MNYKKLTGALLAAALLGTCTISAGAFADRQMTVPMTRLAFCEAAAEMLTDAGVSLPSTASLPFSDTTSGAVSALYAAGVAQGTSDTTFSPEDTLTRAEAATFMDRMCKLMPVAAKDAAPLYSDAASIPDWAQDSAARLRAAGIMIGTDPGVFSPFDTLTEWQAKTLLLRLQNAGKPNTITSLSYEDALDTICSDIRYVGTAGEAASAKQLSEAFRSFGYEVTEQSVPLTDLGTTGTNVIATRPATNGNGDILIISAHHDSMPTTTGANDNGSGTALVLELARALQDVPTDTELRFIAFTAEEEGTLGSSYYVSQLSDEEKNHIVGDIQIDMVGHYMSTGNVINSLGGQATLLGGLINDSAVALGQSKLGVGEELASDHLSFILDGIPSVYVMQDNLGVENHRWSDNVEIIDPAKVTPLAKTLERTIRTIASTETGSLVQSAREQSDLSNMAYTITDETVFYMGEKKSLTDMRIGGTGTVVDTYYDDHYQRNMEVYRLNTKWFGIDKVIPTDLLAAVGDDGTCSLEGVYIHYSDLGFTKEQMSAKLTELYGEMNVYEGGASDWEAGVPSNRIYSYTTVRGEEVLSIDSSHHQVGEVLATYDLTKPLSDYANVDPRHYKLIDLMQKVMKPDDAKLTTLNIWSDGYSYVLGQAEPITAGDNSRWQINLDLYDTFNADGSFKRLDRALATIVHEYGHVLTENDDQMAITDFDAAHGSAETDTPRDGSYLQAFIAAFRADDDSTSFVDHPENFVNEYASTNSFEDIAESFAQFVLSKRQTGSTLAAQKINFFYAYPELVTLRDQIRANFDFPA